MVSRDCPPFVSLIGARPRSPLPYRTGLSSSNGEVEWLWQRPSSLRGSNAHYQPPTLKSPAVG